MTRRLPLFVYVLFACVCCLPGCHRAAPEQSKIILLTAHRDRPFEGGQCELLTRLMAKDPSAVLEIQDAGGGSRKQSAQFDQAASARPSAILIQCVDGAALATAINAAAKSGILVIGLGEESSAAGCTTVVSCDETGLGRLAGVAVVEALTQKSKIAGQAEISGRVVEIRGDESSPNCTKRHEGFMEALKAAPGLILVHDAPGGWTQDGGMQRMKDATRLQKSFDAVFAHNDQMALGACRAAGAQRKDMFIVGMDSLLGPEGGSILLKLGDIDATIYQPALVDFAWVLIRHKADVPDFQPKPVYRLTPRIIRPADAESILRNGLPPFPTF